MLKLPKKEWLTRFAGTPLESISEWVRYYYISPVDYSYNDDGNIIKIEDVIGVVDLGDLEFSSTSRYISANISDIKLMPSGADVSQLYCLEYKTLSPNDVYNNTQDKSISTATTLKRIWIYDTELIGKSAEEISEALKGKFLIYAKA